MTEIKKPTIVCLCGSRRFFKYFEEANREETLKGKIVLSIGVTSLSISLSTKVKLDILHLRKIDLADEILVLDIGGYIGRSTFNEIEYAIFNNKKIRYWSKEHELDPPCSGSGYAHSPHGNCPGYTYDRT